MSGFLTSLAGLALGAAQPGAARLSLPPRFAPAKQPIGMQAYAAVDAADDAAPVVNPVAERASGASVHALPSLPEPPLATKPEALIEFEKPQRNRAPAAMPLPAARPADTMEPPPRHFPVEPIGQTRAASSQGPNKSPVDRAIEAPRAQASEILQPRPAADSRASAPQAPLSAVAVANHARVERNTRSVVHITIDRIEVRAPREAPKPETAAKRAKAQPSVSLADYLGARP